MDIEDIEEVYKPTVDEENEHYQVIDTLNVEPGRLMALCDGIFGMVMTLLIFGIEVPTVNFSNYLAFNSFLTALLPTIGRYAVCFILVGTFWLYHHEYMKVNKLTVPFVWLNLIYLLLIAFIPFSTMVMEKYALFLEADLLFNVNILLILFVLTLMFYYADSTGILEENIMKGKKHAYHTFLIILGITIVVALLNFSIPGHYIYLYILIPIISSIRDIKFRRKLSKKI